MTKSGFDIDELERLLAAATPGEWEFVAEEVKGANATWLWIAPKTWHTRVARVVVYKTQEDEQEANATLIVTARNSLPTILTEIRELRAEHARLREALSHAQGRFLNINIALSSGGTKREAIRIADVGEDCAKNALARAALGEPQ